MKKSRFSEEQIAYALKQAEAGNKVQEICRQMGISQATFFNWKDMPPFIRPLLLGKNPFAEPEIPPVSAFLKHCAGGSNDNPLATLR